MLTIARPVWHWLLHDLGLPLPHAPRAPVVIASCAAGQEIGSSPPPAHESTTSRPLESQQHQVRTSIYCCLALYFMETRKEGCGKLHDGAPQTANVISAGV